MVNVKEIVKELNKKAENRCSYNDSYNAFIGKRYCNIKSLIRKSEYIEKFYNLVHESVDVSDNASLDKLIEDVVVGNIFNPIKCLYFDINEREETRLNAYLLAQVFYKMAYEYPDFSDVYKECEYARLHDVCKNNSDELDFFARDSNIFLAALIAQAASGKPDDIFESKVKILEKTTRSYLVDANKYTISKYSC